MLAFQSNCHRHAEFPFPVASLTTRTITSKPKNLTHYLESVVTVIVLKFKCHEWPFSSQLGTWIKGREQTKGILYYLLYHDVLCIILHLSIYIIYNSVHVYNMFDFIKCDIKQRCNVHIRFLIDYLQWIPIMCYWATIQSSDCGILMMGT